MAHGWKGCDQPRVRLHVVEVTDSAPEPTLAAVLAAVNALVLKVDGISNKTDDLFEATAAGFGHVMTELAGVKADVGDLKGDTAALVAGQNQLRADVAELKVEFGLLEARVDDAHRAILRHGNDPNAHPDAA